MNTFSMNNKGACVDGKQVDCISRVRIDLFPNEHKSLVTLERGDDVIISENVDSEISIGYDTSSYKQGREWHVEWEAGGREEFNRMWALIESITATMK